MNAIGAGNPIGSVVLRRRVGAIRGIFSMDNAPERTEGGRTASHNEHMVFGPAAGGSVCSRVCSYRELYIEEEY